MTKGPERYMKLECYNKRFTNIIIRTIKKEIQPCIHSEIAE